MRCGALRKCSSSTIEGATAVAASNRLLRRTSSWLRRASSIRRDSSTASIAASLRKDTCRSWLGSPTTSVALPRRSAGAADVCSTAEASSTTTRSNKAGLGGSRSSTSLSVPTHRGSAVVRRLARMRCSWARRAARPLRSAVDSAATALSPPRSRRSCEREVRPSHSDNAVRTAASAASAARQQAAGVGSWSSGVLTAATSAAATTSPRLADPGAWSSRRRVRSAFRRRRRASQPPPPPFAAVASAATVSGSASPVNAAGACSRACANAAAPPGVNSSSGNTARRAAAHALSRLGTASSSWRRARSTAASGAGFSEASRWLRASRRSLAPNTTGSSPGWRSSSAITASTAASDLAVTSTLRPRRSASATTAATVCDFPVPGAPDTTVTACRRTRRTTSLWRGDSGSGDSTAASSPASSGWSGAVSA